MASPAPNITGDSVNRLPVKWNIYTAAGAIEIDNEVTYIGSAGALAMTLAAPTNPDMNGQMMTIIATTAQAHTVTVTLGFNAGGAGSDVATFGGAIGDSMIIRAYNGYWYVVSLRNVTLG